MAISADAKVLTMLKEYYSDKSPEDTFFRGDPLLRSINKIRAAGKSYNLSITYGNGGAAAGDLLVATDSATSNGAGANGQFAVTPGQLFGTATLSQQEIMASQNTRGAFIPMPVKRLADSLDSFRKLAATALYGTGYGEIGQITNATTVAIGDNNSFTASDYSMLVKLSIGTKFRVCNNATIKTPDAPFAAGIFTVTKVDGFKVFFNSTVAGGFAVGQWICLHGCRVGDNGDPLLPVGLGGWLPYLGNRTGADWNTYIDKSFFGIKRSANTNGLAGQFVQKVAAESYRQTVVRALNAVRIAGGIPDVLVLNSEDYLTIINEANAQTTYFQQMNMPGQKGSSPAIAAGLSDMKYAFASTWVETVYDSAFVPKGKAWVLEKDQLDFVGLNSMEPALNDGIIENNPGKQLMADTPAPTLDYSWLINDYLTVQPASITANGPALQMIVQVYANFVVNNPSKCCAISFV